MEQCRGITQKHQQCSRHAYQHGMCYQHFMISLRLPKTPPPSSPAVGDICGYDFLRLCEIFTNQKDQQSLSRLSQTCRLAQKISQPFLQKLGYTYPRKVTILSQDYVRPTLIDERTTPDQLKKMMSTTKLKHAENMLAGGMRGDTLLHECVRVGNLLLVEYLFQHFGKKLLEVGNVYGETPLTLALTEGQIPLALKLLEFETPVNLLIPELRSFDHLIKIEDRVSEWLSPLHVALLYSSIKRTSDYQPVIQLLQKLGGKDIVMTQDQTKIN